MSLDTHKVIRINDYQATMKGMVQTSNDFAFNDIFEGSNQDEVFAAVTPYSVALPLLEHALKGIKFECGHLCLMFMARRDKKIFIPARPTLCWVSATAEI